MVKLKELGGKLNKCINLYFSPNPIKMLKKKMTQHQKRTMKRRTKTTAIEI